MEYPLQVRKFLVRLFFHTHFEYSRCISNMPNEYRISKMSIMSLAHHIFFILISYILYSYRVFYMYRIFQMSMKKLLCCLPFYTHLEDSIIEYNTLYDYGTSQMSLDFSTPFCSFHTRLDYSLWV